jgi:hypothetical protein
MRHKRERELKIDLERFIILEYKETGELFAVDKVYYHKEIEPIQRKYDFYFNSCPENIIICCYPVIKDGNETYSLRKEFKLDIQLKTLKPSWIEIRK